MALRPSSSPPSYPCAPDAHTATLAVSHHQSYSRPTYRTHTITPAPHILHSLHSVAHEPDEEPCRLQGGGSHRRVHDCHHAGLDNSHTHIEDVPLAPPPRCSQAHHSADAPLLSTMQDLLGWVSSCHPVCTASSARGGACLDVFAYSATDAYALGASIVSSWRGLCPLLDDAAGKSDTSHLPATADAAALVVGVCKSNNRAGVATLQQGKTCDIFR